MVAAKNNAKHVVLSDYPDESLLKNLERNLRENDVDRASVQGYIWGRRNEPLMEVAPGGFQVIILSDLVFNHSEHDALIATCERCLATDADARVLVFYTHHRPHLAHRDMEFFEKARDRGWNTQEVLKSKYGAMFEEDAGDVEIRSVVCGVSMSRCRVA
ncbi:hypothetical protein C8F01DRAFT_1124374 [Mycena amicta]|nr:hypothetical protein C8F01DRAFT_1124374 [Mycena amicta]